MTTTCRICGETLETSGALEGPRPLEHERCRADAPPPRAAEPSYESDLRELIARSCSSLPVPPRDEASVDVPPSVREAIRRAGGLLPLAAPPPSRRLRLAALLVVGLALAGIALGAPRGPRRAAAPPAPPAAEALPAPPAVAEEALPSPPAPPSAVEPAPERSPDQRPLPGRRPIPAAARLRAGAAGTAAPTTPPDLPTLMQAITDAVKTRPAPSP
jgi:hypothetical protein